MSMTVHEIEAASARIAPYIIRTPLIRMKHLDPYLGCEVYVKAECMQTTGSFKLRGAMNKILSLSEEELKRGIVAASSGNHGKAVAYACKMLGIQATIVLPDSVARIKEDTIRKWGAEIVKCDVSERFETAEKLCRQKNAEKEFSAMLPDGPETAGQLLMAIEDAKNGKAVGWIWFFYEESAGVRQVFLYDLLIFQSERRKGYASAALDEMAQMAKAAGCARSMLYVWEHSVPGFNLYQKCGYTAVEKSESGMYMKKDLTGGKYNTPVQIRISGSTGA